MLFNIRGCVRESYIIFLANRKKMNPKVVMMVAKQVQECQKKTPDGMLESI